MMTRFTLTLVLGVLLGGVFSFVGESQAHVDKMYSKSASNTDYVDEANGISCERIRDNPVSFASFTIFESWFPKRLFLKHSGWKNIEGQKSIKLVEDKRVFWLLPNGYLMGSMPGGGHHSVSNIKYKCDATAQEVLASQKMAGSVTTVSEKHSSITLVEKRLQALGALTILRGDAFGTDWANKRISLPEAEEPANSVGHMFWWVALCEGGEIAGVYNAVYPTELFEGFNRLASNRDWALFRNSSFGLAVDTPIPKDCSPGKVNQVNVFLQETLSWLEENKGSNLSNYFKGQSDGVTQAASVGTTSSKKPSGDLVKCERYNTTNGDSVVGNGWIWKNFDYFYQQSLIVSVKEFKKTSGRKSLTSKRQWHRSKWPHGGHVAKKNSGASHLMQQFTLFPSGKLVSNIPNPRVRFGKSMASYKCDKTSIEVAALLDKLEKQPVTEVVEQKSPTKVNDPFAEAKVFCSDLGFTSGTEKHGNCVLKIASNSGSEVASASSEAETASNDNKLPTITIASANTKGKQGIIRGKARDNTGIAEVTVAGKPITFDTLGNFKYETFVPTDGKEVKIQVTDLNGLSNSKTVKLNRSASNTTTAITFESLNPLGRKVAKNKDALALIIGVDGYENTPARAIYADSDAKVFADYANEKLGIPANRIKTLVNDGADEKGMLLAVKDWLSRASKRDKTDVYVFFAGHGLASQDGQKMYLLPYDGSPRLLEKTAILRDELFADIAAANPRSVTVFLDTCYSGETRGNEMLIAGRPIGIRVLEQSIPDNFTLMTAAAGDQIANPLKEAKHGMFSYFLMKGMEGEADKNQDNKITAGELHQYVQQNVVQQSSGSQTPELQGDAERVLVRFQ